MNYRDIITIEPGKRGSRPCDRGMRITVYDVLDYLASGMSQDEVLSEIPDAFDHVVHGMTNAYIMYRKL